MCKWSVKSGIVKIFNVRMMSDYALSCRTVALIVFYLICLWSQKKKKKEDNIRATDLQLIMQ